MASNVELQVVRCRQELIESPDVDIHTQRPRTPNTLYSAMTDAQIKSIKSDSSPLFRELVDGSASGRPLTNQSRCIRPKGENELEEEEGHGQSRRGAFYEWRVRPWKVDKNRNYEYNGRPLSTIDRTVVMKYGRPTQGFYEPFDLTCIKEVANVSQKSPEESLREMEEENRKWEELKNRPPGITEYVDRYCLRSAEKF